MANARAFVERWFEEVWHQGREATIDELFAADGIAFGLSEGDVDLHGPPEFKPFVRNLRNAFPDIHISVHDVIAEGDQIAARVVLEGTHKGDGLGMPPTGKQVRVAGIVWLRLRDGKIVAGWNSWDQLGLLRQIGAIPAPGGPDRFVAAHSQ